MLRVWMLNAIPSHSGTAVRIEWDTVTLALREFRHGGEQLTASTDPSVMESWIKHHATTSWIEVSPDALFDIAL